MIHFCLSAFFSSFYFPMQPLRFEMAAVMCQFRTQVREGYLRDQYTSPARGAVNPALIAYRPHASAFTGTLQQLKSLSRIEAWNNFPRGQLWYIRATWVEPGTPPEFARRSIQKALSAFFFFSWRLPKCVIAVVSSNKKKYIPTPPASRWRLVQTYIVLQTHGVLSFSPAVKTHHNGL